MKELDNRTDEEVAADEAAEAAYIAEQFEKIRNLKNFALHHNICEAVCNSLEVLQHPFREMTEAEEENPVMVLVVRMTCTCSSCSPYNDQAAIFLRQSMAQMARNRSYRERAAEIMEGKEPQTPAIEFPYVMDGLPRPQPGEFISLERFLAMNTGFPRVDCLPDWLFHEPNIDQIIWFFFFNNRHVFDEAIERACVAVYQGVPLYTQDGDAFTRLPPTHPDAIYLARKYEHSETANAGSERMFDIPEWAKTYYFKWDDLQAREMLFGRWRTGHPEAGTRALRTALWRMLGVHDTPSDVPAIGNSGRADRPSHVQRLFAAADEILPLYNEDGTFGDRTCSSVQKSVHNYLERRGFNTAEQQAIYVMTRPKNGNG